MNHPAIVMSTLLLATVTMIGPALGTEIMGGLSKPPKPPALARAPGDPGRGSTPDWFTGTEARSGDADKKPGAVERLKQKVLGDRPEREPDPVKAAQRALRDYGYDPGPVDGNLGPKTRAAIEDFQAAEGLKVTGRLDTDTMNRLRARRTDDKAERKDRDAGRPSALPRQDRETTRPGPGASSESPYGELAKDAAKTRK